MDRDQFVARTTALVAALQQARSEQDRILAELTAQVRTFTGLKAVHIHNYDDGREIYVDGHGGYVWAGTYGEFDIEAVEKVLDALGVQHDHTLVKERLY